MANLAARMSCRSVAGAFCEEGVMLARCPKDSDTLHSVWRAVGLVMALAGAANADEALDFDRELQVHAFVSQGFLKSTHNDFLADSSRGSFEFFEAGLNVSRSMSSELRLGMQLFTRDLGPTGDYKVNVDWAYLDYRWRDWLGVRAGRIKIPFGLYNDSSDIDSAHPSAILPQAVYPAANRDFLLAQTGGELYGYRSFGKAGQLDYRVYGGTIFLDLPAQRPGSPIALLNLRIPYLVGGRVFWETPIDGLRIGASLQKLRLETDILDLRDPTMPAQVSADIPATLAQGSIEYIVDDFAFAAEYARWYTRIESSDPMRFPETKTTNERAYGLVSYRVSPRIQPSAYYGVFYPRAGETEGRASKHHDAAATLRIDITPNWLIKLEAHHMRGTAGLSTSLNGVASLEELANRWQLFVVKTTAYF
jgi:hypothetical protein